MKIYRHGAKDRNATMFVQPGNDHPERPEWMTQERHAPTGEMRPVAIMFTVKFEDGVATVDDSLGNYMLDRQMAKRGPIAEPEIEGAVQYNQIPEQRVFS